MSKSKTPNRISIYLGQPLKEFLRRRPLRPDFTSLDHARLDRQGGGAGPEISESTALNRMAERYAWLMQQNFPLLSEETWLSVLNAYNSKTESTLHDIEWYQTGVADDLGYEAEDFHRPREEWHIAVREMADLSPSQKLVVAEVTESFWGGNPASPGRVGEDMLDLRDLLADIAGRPRFSVYKEDRESWRFWRVAEKAPEGERELWTLEHEVYPELRPVVEIRTTRKGKQVRLQAGEPELFEHRRQITVRGEDSFSNLVKAVQADMQASEPSRP